MKQDEKNQCPKHGPYKIINTQNENSILEVNEKYHNNTLKLFKKNLNFIHIKIN